MKSNDLFETGSPPASEHNAEEPPYNSRFMHCDDNNCYRYEHVKHHCGEAL